jgi:hypothetical protein
MRRRGMRIGFWYGSQNLRDHLDLDVDERIILKLLLHIQDGIL